MSATASERFRPIKLATIDVESCPAEISGGPECASTAGREA
jgi:hypothetical protein